MLAGRFARIVLAKLTFALENLCEILRSLSPRAEIVIA